MNSANLMQLRRRAAWRSCALAVVILCHCHICPIGQAQSAAPHAWRPPFGLDRIGHSRPADAEVPCVEADVIAHVRPQCNPVDLGAILVPHGWLLLGPGQSAELDCAAVSWGKDAPSARLIVSLASDETQRRVIDMPLRADEVARQTVAVPAPRGGTDRDVLHVRLQAADRVLWHKQIPMMLVNQPPKWPRFGAVRTRLRYDAPISVRNQDGTFSQLAYDAAWDPELDDVVVLLPNGARFVFWRGSCYVPFWAGQQNTALSYEWAETSPPPDGFADCVEPLMDKELRYGRVEIIESTAARVHVRWTYQSCDFNYKVWGDSAVEDFYFYPDGFGARVLTIHSDPSGDYELSEFIILTPQGTYPLSVLPENLVDIVFLDGERRELSFPYDATVQGDKLKSRDMTALYRVRLHKDDPHTAIYFHPTETQLPPVVFAPFYDQGQLVTPCYWGSHWPLARGQTTGGSINDRVHDTPCHNSVMTWSRQRPKPLREAIVPSIDTLGRSKTMHVQTWAWLIGMSDDGDDRLLDIARSYRTLPSVRLEGGRLAAIAAAPERRAVCIVAEQPVVHVQLTPQPVTVNPVLEIEHAFTKLETVELDGKTLGRAQWAWDGETLWVEATLSDAAQLTLRFSGTK